MWRAGVDVKVSADNADDDEWETDPDFVVRCSFVALQLGLKCLFPLFDFHRNRPGLNDANKKFAAVK